MTDLDSSLLLRDIPVVREGLEILRDLISAIHKMFLHFAILQCRGVAGLDVVREYSILTKLLTGYFDDISENRIGAVAEDLIKIWDADFVALKEWPRDGRLAGEGDLYLRRDWFYTFALLKLSPLFVESHVGSAYSGSLNDRRLMQSARSYLQEEFAAFCCKAALLPG